MDWSVIILALFAAIRQCIADRNNNREVVESRLKIPGIREAGAIRRVLRKEGLHGAELRSATQDAMDELVAMTAVEIEELVTDAEEAGPISTVHVSLKGT